MSVNETSATPGSGRGTAPRCGIETPPVLTRLSIVLVLGLFFVGCGGRVSERQARALVDAYVRAVSEAYRRADVTLVDNIVGAEEGKRLTGLIGVRQDMGISLDAEATSVEITKVETTDSGDLIIRTKEIWHYRDRRIGTGEQVGAESLDHYELMYLFRRDNGRWLVVETKFTAPPQVGRATTPWGVEHGAMMSGPEQQAPKGDMR